MSNRLFQRAIQHGKYTLWFDNRIDLNELVFKLKDVLEIRDLYTATVLKIIKDQKNLKYDRSEIRSLPELDYDCKFGLIWLIGLAISYRDVQASIEGVRSFFESGSFSYTVGGQTVYIHNYKLESGSFSVVKDEEKDERYTF